MWTDQKKCLLKNNNFVFIFLLLVLQEGDKKTNLLVYPRLKEDTRIDTKRHRGLEGIRHYQGTIGIQVPLSMTRRTGMIS